MCESVGRTTEAAIAYYTNTQRPPFAHKLLSVALGHFAPFAPPKAALCNFNDNDRAPFGVAHH